MNEYLDTVVQGDCLEVLRELPDCSVELCATDPPYALSNGPNATGGFMGKAWDAALPARAIWAEVLRVLKPGASCFVCAGSRQDTILGLLTDLREVGFDIQHAALSWVYWSGFPKSSCVSKQCDKAAFLTWLRETPEGETETRQALMGWDAADVRKAASAAVNGCYSETLDCTGKQVGKPPKAGDRDDLLRYGGDNERPWATGGRGTGTLLLSALQARFGDAPGVRAKAADYMAPRQVEKGTYRSEWTESIGGDSTGAFCTSGELTKHSTAPATPEAVEWDGWHSGSVPLKPSAEQILWVTKPAEPGPARLNVLKWGVGAVNVAECRVPTEDKWTGGECNSGPGTSLRGSVDGTLNTSRSSSHAQGRYPSNLLVSSRALGDDSKYGDLDAWARERGLSDEWLDAALSAGVLRVPKPSRSEKNAGCEGLEETFRPTRDGGPDARSVNTDKRGAICRNGHPTCKPVTLMAFLCTLACPRAGVVLDPFLGSGTTAVAAVQSGMHFIGIEREPEYVAIAEARIAAAFRDRQPTLALDAAE